MIPHRTLLKLTIPILVILIAGCSSARYGYVQRAELNISNKISAEKIRTGIPESAIITSSIQSTVATKSYLSQTTAIRNEIKAPTVKLSPKEKTAYKYLISHQPIMEPDDSVEIDIKQETKIAEKFGNTGFVMGLVSLLAFSPLAILGIIFSGIAFYKMSSYELEVKNRGQVIAGLILNIVAICKMVLVILLLISIF
jgi:hypothetical protein